MCTVCKLISILNVWMLCYTGNVQTFTAPLNTNYKLEVWGAQGGVPPGTATIYIPYGGYSQGWLLNVNSNTKLYIVVGRKGVYTGPGYDTPYNESGGYNGGGNAGSSGNSGGGGGATHVSTTNRGALSNYKNNKTEVLIVAGGAGGNGQGGRPGGIGGGLSGGNSILGALGGTQVSGYAFGKGQDVAIGKDDGGGGGGWYGGTTEGADKSGGGGSGYIGGVTNGSTISGVQSGNGKAVITWIPAL